MSGCPVASLCPMFDGLELENEHLRLRVLPARGGKVTSILDRSADREWIWDPGGDRRQAGLGDDYDENWQGGFEELFPNDSPTQIAGYDLPDHGELWSAEWAVVDASDVEVVLRVTGPVTGVVVTKSFDLDGSTVSVRYRLEHRGAERLPFLFKLHPAIAVDQDCRIELPGGRVEAVDPAFSRLLEGSGPWPWPGPPEADLERCRESASGLQEFVYVRDLPDGWCAVTDERLGRRLRLSYDMSDFPFCWLFITYGGWRGHEVVVLEPCTNYPKDLHEAVGKGTTAWLEPGETKTLHATFSLEDQ